MNNGQNNYDEELEFYRQQLMDDEDIAFLFGCGEITSVHEQEIKKPGDSRRPGE
tara:strand:- start:207 stop:368 length:162 start_codon:yes stop_codon:yes gene_type:complete